MRVATGNYAGNSTDGREITDPGFQPDFVLIQNSSFDGCVFRTSSHSGDDSSVPWTGTGNEADSIQSFTASGFTVGANAKVNVTGKTYRWIAVKNDGDSSSGIRVGTYTGNGADGRSITVEAGFQPDFVLLKANNGTVGFLRTSDNTGDQSHPIDSGTETANAIQAFEANGFQVGSHNGTNEDTKAIYYVAFKDQAGGVFTTQYTGNNTDARDITGVGFNPDFVLIQRLAGGDSVAQYNHDGIGGDNTLSMGPVGFSTNRIQSVAGADGFQVGNDATVNGTNTNTYNYIALANDPFVAATGGTNAHRTLMGVGL